MICVDAAENVYVGSSFTNNAFRITPGGDIKGLISIPDTNWIRIQLVIPQWGWEVYGGGDRI